MLYTLALLNFIAALLLLVAFIGLIPRVCLKKRELTVVGAIVLMHLTSTIFGNVQIMSGALATVDESQISFTIWISFALRIIQIVFSILLIVLNIRAYMKDHKDV